MNEEQNNQTQVEELETLNEEKDKFKYEQQTNELINSVTMADLVDPTIVEQKKKKKGLVITLVVVVLVLGVTSILFLNNGTFSAILGKTTTSELDVFKTDETSTSEVINDNDYAKFEKVDNRYIFDISGAGNGVRLKYYLKSNLVAYIAFADDFETSKNFTFNLNNSDYYIEDTNPGELSLTVESDYIVFMNSNNEDAQVILSKKGVKLEDDPSVDINNISTTKATTTTTTVSMVHKEFHFETTTDENGRTTRVETEYDPSWDMIDYIWYDEDGIVHYVQIGSEESREHHPELYTTTTETTTQANN